MRVPLIAAIACLALLAAAPCLRADGPDAAPQQLSYQVDPGTVLEYQVNLFYDWTRTASSDTAALAAIGSGGPSQPNSTGQPWYAVHDPAEVLMRGRLEALAGTDDALRFRFTYGPAQVHFFDDTTQLKLDYANKPDRERADKRMAQLQDPKTSERFEKILGRIANPFVHQFWRVLAYSKMTGWSFEFTVPRRGGAPKLDGFASGLRERLPAFVPDESRELMEADAVDFLGLIFPALPSRDDLVRGSWSASAEATRYKYDGIATEAGRKCLRFANAERRSVTRTKDEAGDKKQTDRLDESIVWSPDERITMDHAREVRSSVLENQKQAKDSVFGIGKSTASVHLVKKLTTDAARGPDQGQ